MSEEAYALQDVVLRERLREIVVRHGVKCVVETGTYHGLSLAAFASMVPTVVGVDSNPDCLTETQRNLAAAGVWNVLLCLGNSPWVLGSLGYFLPNDTLYFLDAHWNDYWPLLDEIAAVRPGTGVIVIHDCKVPGHPELGYDSYGGHDLDYNYVRRALLKWSLNHRVEYNRRTEGCEKPRGVMYVYPR